MTLRSYLLGGLGLMILLAVGIPLFLHYLDVREEREEYILLVEEGFQLLQEAGAGGARLNEPFLDEAISKGMSARKLDPEGEEAGLLLGRAYYMKEDITRCIEALKQGLKDFQDVDYLAEFNYHLALAYTRRYKDLKQRDMFNDALSSFSNTASSSQSFHRVDAYFGITTLYLIRLQDTESLGDKEKALQNLRRAMELETGMEGYVEGEEGSICPLCRMEFKKKSDDPGIVELRRQLERQ
jgi:tetratricopeptide (TPR) repeat protein